MATCHSESTAQISQCLMCGYTLKHIPHNRTSQCPECGTLILSSQHLSDSVDHLTWDLCVSVRRGINIFTIGIVLVFASFLAGLIVRGNPWIHLGGTSLAILIASVGVWKMGDYYTRKKNMSISVLVLRASIVILTISLVGAIALITAANPTGWNMIQDENWNIVWSGLLVAMGMSLCATLYLSLQMADAIANWCNNKALMPIISRTRYLSAVFVTALAVMRIWDFIEPTSNDIDIINLSLYQFASILILILSLFTFWSWGKMIYFLNDTLKVRLSLRTNAGRE